MPPLEPRTLARGSHNTTSRPQYVISSMDSDPPRLSRVLIGQHLDDQSHYQERGEAVGEGRVDKLQSYTLNKPDNGNDAVSQSTIAEEHTENGQGIVNEHDVEAPLEKARSSRSVKDPDLVRFSSSLRRLHS